MRRVIALLFLVGLPLAVWADGKVYPPRAIPIPVNIPDQRALICWSNGVERLVIETRFTGEGTDFAWVVPLPAKPVIEPATPGVFPTLDYLMSPELVHQPTRWYLGVLAVLGLIYLMYTVKPGQELGLMQWSAWLLVSVCTGAAFIPAGVAVGLFLATAMILVRTESGSFFSVLVLALLALVFSGLFLPALGRSKASATAGATGGGNGVAILERKQAGVFDTTVLAVRDAPALNAWLRENGFAVATNADPVVASYIKEGWVFVAAKVHRDESTAAPTAPHPLSFTFASTEAVYPMRLTGVDNGAVWLELFVFGPGLASAPGFDAGFCARPEFPGLPQWWVRWKPNSLRVYSSPLREWVQGAPAASRLTARLSPGQMTRDVRLQWLPFEEKRSTVYSAAGAGGVAANWASAVLATGLFLVSQLSPSARKRGRRRSLAGAGIAALAIVVGGVIYFWLPKVPVQVQAHRYGRNESQLYELAMLFEDAAEGATLSKGRSELVRILKDPRYAGRWDNDFSGGTIREEDSPGNYLIREAGGGWEFIGYDAAGAPHVVVTSPRKLGP